MVGGEDLYGAIQDLDAAADDVLNRFLPNELPEVVRAHHVVAVLVAHDGAQWLPRTLDAVEAQVSAPGLVVGVDAGSDDDSADWLARTCQTVVAVGRDEGLPGALAAGVGMVAQLAAVGVAERPAPRTRAIAPATSPDPGGRREAWYWILHDDTAPNPDCLHELLAGADRNPGAAVVVPKAVSWSDPEVLVGIGHKWAPGTPVVERLERGERDQGQYDFDRPVHVAESGGMLVRADAWHALGGFDGFTGTWCSPYDFCRRVWGAGGSVVFVPRAVVAHRMAGHRGVRASAHGRQWPRRAARRGQLYLELTQAPAIALPGRILRAVLSTVLRTLGVLLTREPEESTAELAGAWDVLGHPRRLAEGRRRARRPPVGDLTRPPECRAYRGTATKRLLEHWVTVSRVRWRPPRRWRLRSEVWRPLALAGALAVAAVLRRPDQLVGSGDLQGGGLLPAPGAMSLLGAYSGSWQDAWFGSAAVPPPYLALLAAAGALALGSVDAVLRTAVTFAVPIAFLSAYASIGPRLAPTRRTALSLAWACLPAGVAASGSGRVSTLGLLLLGPPAARALVRWWELAGRRPPVRPALVAGTLLGVVSSFAPLVLVVVTLAAGVAWVLRRLPRGPRARSGVVVIAVASAFLVPWAVGLGAAPWLLLTEVGRNAGDLGQPGPVVLGLSPGGPGSVAWAGVPLLIVSVLVVLLARPVRGAGVALAAAWALLATAAWAAPLAGRLWGVPAPSAIWSGQALLMAGGLLAWTVARTAGSAGAPRALDAAGALCVLALVAGWWTAPVGPTAVTDDSPLPPVAALSAEGPGRVRALVLRGGSEELEYAVSSGPSVQLGDADALAALAVDEEFDDLVRGLVSGAGGDVGPELGERGIRYVVFNGSPTDGVVSELDAVLGLRRLASSEAQSLWLVADAPVRARLGEAPGAGPVDVPVLTTPTSVDVVLHPSTVLPRPLELAERADDGWRASLAGEALALTATDRGMLTAQVTGTGRLTVRHEGIWRLLAPAHLGLIAALGVLSLPKRRAADPGELP